MLKVTEEAQKELKKVLEEKGEAVRIYIAGFG